MKERKVVERKRATWHAGNVKHRKRIVRRRQRVWQNYKEHHHWKAYTVERNRLN